MENTIHLTPEEYVALHAIPTTALLSRYYFWCGICALYGLKLPQTIHDIEYVYKNTYKIKTW